MNISMVIPTYNRGLLLEKNLDRLCCLTSPDEILVIDDGGCDDTEAICAGFSGLLPVRYVYHDNPGWSNRCAATNVGIKLASGDEILGSDAELLFLTDVVRQLRRARRQDSESVLCAETMYREPYQGAPPEEWTEHPGGYVSLYKRSWLLEVGGWDEQLPGPAGYDDCDLHTRLEARGHPQIKVPGTAFRHRWHPSYEYQDGELNGGRNPNLAYLDGKGPEDLVANQGRDWGVLRARRG